MSLFNYECDEVKRKIEEVSPNYPQLTTYEKEWLYFHKYGYIPGIPVELEYETVSVNPTGSVSNAIPFNYKSAILKGNTIKKIGLESGSYNGYLEKIAMNDRLRITEPVNGYDIIRIDCKNDYQAYIRGIGINSDWGQSLSMTFTPEQSFVILFKKNDGSVFGQSDYGNIIEYTNIAEISDNNDNELVSVKMPVLTTSNEDGTKTNILTVNEEVELRGIMDVRDELNLLTGELTQCVGEIILNGSEDWTLSSLENSRTFYTTLNNLVHKKDYLNSISCDKFVVHTDEFTLHTSISPNGISGYVDKTDTYPNENWLYIKHTDSKSSVEKFKQWLSQNPITVQYQLTTESVKTVALTPLNNPYEGTNHYELTSNIPCEAILEVPVVSTGKQTLVEINN